MSANPLNASDRAKVLLATDGGPTFLADWTPAMFVHYEIDPRVLQPHVPFALDVRDGKAYVSIVAFTQHDLRPRIGGRVTALLAKPLATHAFLNLRTYVRVNGEAGIYFLAEWIPNRLATLVGPPLYGLPYRLGKVTVEENDERFSLTVSSEENLNVSVRLTPRAKLAPACAGTLTAYLVERYVAFTQRNNIARRFRIWHRPWPIVEIDAVDVRVDDDSLLATFPWHAAVRIVGAAYSPGVADVEIGRPVRLVNRGAWHTWIPLIALPTIALALRDTMPAWVFMWTLAFAIYAGCKWATLFRDRATARMPLTRKLAYLILWAGMNPTPFARRATTPPPTKRRDLVAGLLKTFFGAATLFIASRIALHPLLTGWIAMIATALFLHFGLFHLLALIWHRAGVDVRPIMNRPLLATSTADFWGKRWNTGFHTLAETLIFRRAARRFGIGAGVMLTFFASGLVHDAVISLPARAGVGLPTLYFLLQGIAILLERTRSLRRRPLLRRAMTFAVVILPAPLLLFHPPFVERVILPFIAALGVIDMKGWIESMLALNSTTFIFLGGLLHFGILIASALTPGSLAWKFELAKLPPMLRKLIWVHGVFIVLVIIAFGMISLTNAAALTSGSSLARAMCAFISLFWLARLGVQFFVFKNDAAPYLHTRLLRWGYHGLTFVFAYLTLVYGWSAAAGRMS